jgi:hypothetical protein
VDLLVERAKEESSNTRGKKQDHASPHMVFAENCALLLTNCSLHPVLMCCYTDTGIG